MKKGVIALILLAVLIIIVSPGVVGKLAEESVDESLNWAAAESADLVVTSESFDRGWFSSEGQHRISLQDGQIRDALTLAAGNDDRIPVLLINTHIDHGIIPLSSMGREQGSLAPGLGSAVSTLVVEYGDGETFDIPGQIFSAVGLGGNLDSRYLLEAGSSRVDDGEVTWQGATLEIAANAKTGTIKFDGKVEPVSFGGQQQLVSFDGLTLNGEQATTQYGFNIGDFEVVVDAMTVTAGDVEVMGNDGIRLVGTSSLDDGIAAGGLRFELNEQTVPGFGDMSAIANLHFSGFDAAAIKALNDRFRTMQQTQVPQQTMQLMSAADSELKDLVAAGFGFEIKQLDVALPMGTVESKLTIDVPKADRKSFEWTSLLLNAEAKLDMKIPQALVQMATSLNPQMGAVIAAGYLVQEGDYYVLDAELRKGLFKVNDTPIPIPLGAFQ